MYQKSGALFSQLFSSRQKSYLFFRKLSLCGLKSLNITLSPGRLPTPWGLPVHFLQLQGTQDLDTETSRCTCTPPHPHIPHPHVPTPAHLTPTHPHTRTSHTCTPAHPTPGHLHIPHPHSPTPAHPHIPHPHSICLLDWCWAVWRAGGLEGASRGEGTGEAGVGVRGPRHLLPLGSCVGSPVVHQALWLVRWWKSLSLRLPPRKGAPGSPYRTCPVGPQLHSQGPDWSGLLCCLSRLAQPEGGPPARLPQDRLPPQMGSLGRAPPG